MINWNYTADVLVVSSGGGGMTAALVAAQAGLDALVIEKTELYGGSTALYGGGFWIPNNYLLKRDGLDDSFEKARTYLAHTVGDRVPQARSVHCFLANLFLSAIWKAAISSRQIRWKNWPSSAASTHKN